MSRRKQERLVNLTICLLAARRFITKEQIRQAVEGYRDLKDANFERTFERDKEELRQLGLPIEVGGVDRFFDDEHGYRISRSSAELPPINLTQDEATAVAVAAQVWRQASLGDATTQAMTKLREAGLNPDTSRFTAWAALVSAYGPHASSATIDLLWQAILDRKETRFQYKGALRRVYPWHLMLRQAHWYLQGFDLDRSAERLFKISRFESSPAVVGRSGAYQVPETSHEHTTALATDFEPVKKAQVALGVDCPPSLRAQGVLTEVTSPLPAMSVYEFCYRDELALVGQICAAAPDAIALAPAELREACVRHLQGVLHV